MKKGAIIDFSHFAIINEFDTTVKPGNYWSGQTFIVAVIISIFVNIALVIIFSKSMSFQKFYLDDYGEKSINITLKKYTPMLKQANTKPEGVKVDNADNNVITPTVKSENKNLAKYSQVINSNDNAKFQPLSEYKSLNSKILNENKYQNIFDPRIREKLRENRNSPRRFSNKKQYLNNYSALDNSSYMSFDEKCFNVKSLDGGIKNQHIWIVQCRGVKSISEKMLGNVKQYVKEKYNR